MLLLLLLLAGALAVPLLTMVLSRRPPGSLGRRFLEFRPFDAYSPAGQRPSEHFRAAIVCAFLGLGAVILALLGFRQASAATAQPMWETAWNWAAMFGLSLGGCCLWAMIAALRRAVAAGRSQDRDGEAGPHAGSEA